MPDSRVHTLVWQLRTLGRVVALSTFGLGMVGLAHGEEANRLKVSGFGTLGYWYDSGENDLQFRRELSQNGPTIHDHPERADSRFGLQLNYRLSSQLEAVGQVVIRESAGRKTKDAVEWAFLNFQPTHDIGIRAGRVGLDTFMLSDYRNVGYAYNWVRPPAEFYGWIPFYSIDGGDLSKVQPLGDGHLKLKAFAGETKAGMPWGADSYQLAASSYGLSATWESDEWRFRLGHTRMRFSKDAPFDQLIPALQHDLTKTYWPSAAAYADDLQLNGQKLNYSVVGVAWESDGWQISTEVARTVAHTLFAPQGTSAYVSVGRRFDKWVPHIGFSRNWNSTKLKLSPIPVEDFRPIQDNLQKAYESTHTNQYTATVGLRWDFDDHKALKLQWDRSVITKQGVQMWGDGPIPWNGGHKQIWSATLDFTF